MLKGEFNKLPVGDQAKIINIKGGISALQKKIKISESTLRSRMKSGGYIRNKNTGIFELEDAAQDKPQTQIHKTKTKKYIGEEEDLNYISQNIGVIKSLIDNYKNGNETTKEGQHLQMSIPRGAVVKRTYRIYDEILDEFEDLCKDYNQYKVQDMIRVR